MYKFKSNLMGGQEVWQNGQKIMEIRPNLQNDGKEFLSQGLKIGETKNYPTGTEFRPTMFFDKFFNK